MTLKSKTIAVEGVDVKNEIEELEELEETDSGVAVVEDDAFERGVLSRSSSLFPSVFSFNLAFFA